MTKKIFLILIMLSSFFIGNDVLASGTLDTKTEKATNNSNISPETDLSSSSFKINTSLFSVGGEGLKNGNSKDSINSLLAKIIKNLMIILGLISLFVMTVGAGYMILYHGEDEYLTKGKNIFTGGIIALVIALSSYYLVNLVGYILYK